MNAAQQQKYFAEWAQVRRYYFEHGLDPKQADAKRHALHRKALGRDKSSKAFTNSEFDRVLAVFRAVYDGGNLDAQMEQLSQGEGRRAATVRRIGVLQLHLGLQRGRENDYVGGICRKLFGTPQIAKIDDAQLAQLEGVIVRRLLQLHSKDRVGQIQAEAGLAGVVDDNPF